MNKTNFRNPKRWKIQKAEEFAKNRTRYIKWFASTYDSEDFKWRPNLW